MPEYVVVSNRSAGSAEDERVDAAVAELRRDGSVEVVATDDVDELDAVIAGVGDRRLVLVGGDGSVHLAVDRLLAADRLADVPIGLVPAGTGNDLADALGIPLDPREAARTVAAWELRTLDLIRADDGTICVNALHTGVGVDAAERASDLKDQLGDAAYPLGALAAGATAAGRALSVTVDGGPLLPDEGDDVLLVAVMNGPTYGGGARVVPDARPDDGLLDVLITTATTPGRRAAFGLALQAGRHLERADVAHARGRRVVVSGDPVRYNVDGELSDREYAARTFESVPQAWHIAAPSRRREGRAEGGVSRRAEGRGDGRTD